MRWDLNLILKKMIIKKYIEFLESKSLENSVPIEVSIKYLKKLPKELKEFALNHLQSYTKAKNGKITGLLLPEDLSNKIKEGGYPNGFSLGVDKNGYFIHTHRARSKSYKRAIDIPVKDIKFIDSTG